MQPIIDNPSALLHGDHTRSIVKKTPTARAGGIMMFAVKKLKVRMLKIRKLNLVHRRGRDIVLEFDKEGIHTATQH